MCHMLQGKPLQVKSCSERDKLNMRAFGAVVPNITLPTKMPTNQGRHFKENMNDR